MKIWIAWYLVTDDSCPIGCAWIPTAPILKLIRRINQTAFDCLESVHCKYKRDNIQQQFKRSTEYLSRAEWKCIHISIDVNKNQSLVILPTFFLRDTYAYLNMICIIKRPHFSSRTVCEVLWLVTSIADYRFNNNGIQHLITYTSWNWTVVCEELTKRIRSKNGLFKTSCALKLCNQKQWLNPHKTRPAWIKASWQFPVRW